MTNPLRTARDAAIRKAYRHLQLAAEAHSRADKPRIPAYIDLQKGCASKCLEEARRLTREMHKPEWLRNSYRSKDWSVFHAQAFTDGRGNDISHLVLG